MTHERWPAPPRSPTMVGRAVETIVWSSAASSIPPSTVANTRFIRRRSSTPSAAGVIVVLATSPSLVLAELAQSTSDQGGGTSPDALRRPKSTVGGPLPERDSYGADAEAHHDFGLRCH